MSRLPSARTGLIGEAAIPFRTGGAPAPAHWACAGLILLAIGIALGIAVASDAGFAWELDAMLAVQRPSWPAVDAVAWAASRIGDTWPGLLLISVAAVNLCVVRGRGDLALLLLLASAMRAGGPPLKWLFASPRPPIDAVSVVEQTTGFGYPSGHAFGAALVFGAIAVAAPQVTPNVTLGRLVQVVAVAMMLLIALSRVRLGVHWPTDVAGGLVFGLGVVCLLQAALLAWQQSRARR